jgi:hypothetical protein
MLFKEQAVRSENLTKPKHKMGGNTQKYRLLKQVVHTVTTVF